MAATSAPLLPLFKAVCVVELPAQRRQTGDTSASPASTAPVAPRFVVILPHGDAAQLPKYVLEFCFPDLDQLAARPFHYDHAADEFVFTLTPKDQPAVRAAAVADAALGKGGRHALHAVAAAIYDLH